MKDLYIVGAVLMATTASMAYAQTRTVVFNEIMWMGTKTSYNDDEWIELRNTTSDTVDISGWYITNAKGDTIITIPQGKSILPYDVFLITERDSASSSINVEPDLIATSFTLPNSGLQLKLYADTVLVDVADDGIGDPLAGDNANKYSMVRTYHSDPDSFPKAEDGTLKSSWFTARYSAGWDEEASEKGTPGYPEPAFLRVVPSQDTVTYRDTFTVSIRVEDVINLFSGGFSLSFDSSAVKLVEVDTTSQKGFLGESSFMLDTTFGDSLNVGVTKLGGGGVLGTGTLAELSFVAVGGNLSSSPLDLSEVKLRSAFGLKPILVEPVDDTVTVATLRVLSTSPRDGAVNVIASAPIKVNLDRAPAVAIGGGTFRLTPTVAGSITYHPTSRRAELSPGQLLSGNTQYTAILDKSLGMASDYTWSFTTSVVGDVFDLDDPADQDPEDDYVGDGLVDGDDLAVIGFFWGTTSSSRNWCPLPDLNRDGKVDHSDLGILAQHYGERSSHSPKRALPLVLRSGQGEFIVEAREVDDLYAFHFAVTYDDGALELTEVEDGGFLGGPGEAALIIRRFPGRVIVGGTRLGRIGGVSGSGCLARLRFAPKSGEFPEPTISESLILGSDLSPLGKEKVEIPKFLKLMVLPNPFLPPGRISFLLPRSYRIRLEVYDALGRRVSRLAEGEMQAGTYVVGWDGRDEAGRMVGQGVYSIVLLASGRSIAKKFVLLR